MKAYEDIFKDEIVDLVFRHIDRMNDVCPTYDPAEKIIESFTSQFNPIFETYLENRKEAE